MQNKQIHTPLQESQPLITFIITFYNLPIPMLCECIDSILSLTLSPLERQIIIIDDGSDVSPMNSLMQYADDIIYVRQRNAGLSEARNRGIEMAQGRYLQFVDADDHLIATPYEHCLDLIRWNECLDMVMFGFTSAAAKQQATYNDQPIVSGTHYMLHHNIHGTACGYIFKRTTMSELRFTPDIYHEDEEFTPQLLIRSENVCVTDAKAYYYNQRPHSITSETSEESKAKRLDDILGVILRLRDLCDRVPANDRNALQRRVAQLTMDYIYQTIVQQRSIGQLDQRIEVLTQKGLFPLPERDYSKKYKWFRKLTLTATGRNILVRLLPLLKKER